MVKTDAERQATQRIRRLQRGLRRYEVWLHPQDWPPVKRLVEKLKAARSKS